MVSRQAIWARRRYAEDPEFRKRARASSLRRYAAHKDEIKKRRQERYRTDYAYRERTRERQRERQRRYQARLYGDDYDVLLARQGGVCAICKQKSNRRLARDHCHSTGKRRGLLCMRCNTSLGLHNDDTDRLLAAAAYLEVSRRDIGSVDASVIAAEIAERLRQRAELLLRAGIRVAPRGAARTMG
jgi:hypothetical protein